MKHKSFSLVCLLATMNVFTAQSQTEVTALYLQNADFEVAPIVFTNASGATTLTPVARTGDGIASVYDIPGWTEVYSSWARIGSVMCGLAMTSANVILSGCSGCGSFTAPGNPQGDAAGSCVVLSGAWSGAAMLKQPTTQPLAAGKYALVYATHNIASSTAVGANRFGVEFSNGTSVYGAKTAFPQGVWQTDTVNFNVLAENTVDICAGLVGTNAGSSSNAFIYVDDIRLLYYGVDVDEFQQLLHAKTAAALADTARADNPGFINRQQLRDAIDAAQSAQPTEASVAAALAAIEVAIDEYNAIVAAYEPLKAAIADFAALLTNSIYSHADIFGSYLAAAQAVYDNPVDQRASIAATVAGIERQKQRLSLLNKLSVKLSQAAQTLSATSYYDKAALQAAIADAQAVCDNPEGEDVQAAISALTAAYSSYINGRSSNRHTIRNGALWKDNRGQNVQAHAAGFLQVGDTWYMVGEDRADAGVNLYSTKDFVAWQFEKKIIPPSAYRHPDGLYRFIERPKLLRCPSTGKFVVWCHYEGHTPSSSSSYAASEAASFVCDSVNGIYTMVFSGRPLGVKSRDCNVFVDHDGTAYFISTTSENTDLGLFCLSDDYLYPVSHTLLFDDQGREAPAIVRIGDIYFMFSSACTGWDPNQCKLSHSTSLTSGWSPLQNIGNSIAFDTQAASILTFQGREGTSYVYVGDRWQDPGLAESKTIMFPVTFSGESCTYSYRESFDLDIPLGKTYEADNSVRYVPKSGWSVQSYSSQETSRESSPAANAIDGSTRTMWHTQYSSPADSAPYSISVDMGAECTVSGFLAVPRLDGSTNGLIREFVFRVSADGSGWTNVAGGEWLPYYAEVYFTPTPARYFEIVSLSGSYASIAELEMVRPVSPRVLSVAVAPDSVTLQKGEAHQFNATVGVQDGAFQTVEWAVTGGVAGTSISASGVLTVAAGETASTLTVRATSTVDTAKYGEATVAVASVPVAPKVLSVAVTPGSVSLQKGEALQFSAALAVQSNATQVDTVQGDAEMLTWSVAGGVAGTSISASGLLTVAAGETASTLTVRATSTVDITKYGEATVTLADEAPTGVANALTAAIRLFPNPFRGVLHLTGAEGCTFTVVTATGTPVRIRKVTSADEAIALEDLPAGLYFLRLEKDGKTCTVKKYKY
jgi:hypothetical protein